MNYSAPFVVKEGFRFKQVPNPPNAKWGQNYLQRTIPWKINLPRVLPNFSGA